MRVYASKRPPKNSHPEKQKNAHKNDTKTHIINTLFEETCTRKKAEEHDGFIIYERILTISKYLLLR